MVKFFFFSVSATEQILLFQISVKKFLRTWFVWSSGKHGRPGLLRTICTVIW